MAVGEGGDLRCDKMFPIFDIVLRLLSNCPTFSIQQIWPISKRYIIYHYATITPSQLRGSGRGGPDVACRIKKTAMSHVNVARKIALCPVTSQKYPCRMSLTILAPMSHVDFKE